MIWIMESFFHAAYVMLEGFRQNSGIIFVSFGYQNKNDKLWRMDLQQFCLFKDWTYWTCMLRCLQIFSVFKLWIQIGNPIFCGFNSIGVTCPGTSRRNHVYRCSPSIFIARLDSIITDRFPRNSKVYSSSKKEKTRCGGRTEFPQ